ncbi:uncharacterized protein LOC127711950 [Mytilus californianus]|uniref:uncharacterized protein LOC127711950 n=1 Tax=Mytilus californianus TaxID=6549 RepID=UPI0022482950|nr:uncharacterized protein LOC127711950 [Mytilus californianus]
MDNEGEPDISLRTVVTAVNQQSKDIEAIIDAKVTEKIGGLREELQDNYIDYNLTNDCFEYELGQSDIIVKGRLNIRLWIDIGAPKFIKDTIRDGYILPFYSNPISLGSSQGEGFHFGTTNLACLSRGKRSPSRAVHRLAHRYLKYHGYYYEWRPIRGTENNERWDGQVSIQTEPLRSRYCRHGTESYAAGYGVLCTECVNGCVRYFEKAYYYIILTSNCHHFANWLANILCTRFSCPSECERYR